MATDGFQILSAFFLVTYYVCFGCQPVFQSSQRHFVVGLKIKSRVTWWTFPPPPKLIESLCSNWYASHLSLYLFMFFRLLSLRVRVFDLRSGSSAVSLYAHHLGVTAVRADDWKIVSGGGEGLVCVWEMRMGAKLWEMHNRYEKFDLLLQAGEQRVGSSTSATNDDATLEYAFVLFRLGATLVRKCNKVGANVCVSVRHH